MLFRSSYVLQSTVARVNHRLYGKPQWAYLQNIGCFQKIMVQCTRLQGLSTWSNQGCSNSNNTYFLPGKILNFSSMFPHFIDKLLKNKCKENHMEGTRWKLGDNKDATSSRYQKDRKETKLKINS